MANTIEDRMLRLLERQEFPVGTKRKWKDGEHVKMPDGTWAPVLSKSPTKRPDADAGRATPDGGWDLTPLAPPKVASKAVSRAEASALWKNFEEILSPTDARADFHAQEAARTALTDLTDSYGIACQDKRYDLMFRNQLVLDNSMATDAAWGYHDMRGSIHLSPKIALGAQEFLARFKAKQDPGTPVTYYQPRELRGMKTLIHEHIHGCSILYLRTQYRGPLACFEEATTELAARKILKESFKLSDVEFGIMVDPMNPFNPDSRVSTYEAESEALREAVQAALERFGIRTPAYNTGGEKRWWVSFLGAASIRMRQDAKFAANATQAYRRLAAALPVPKEAWERAAARRGKTADAVEAEFMTEAAEEMLVSFKALSDRYDPSVPLSSQYLPQRFESRQTPPTSPYSLRRNDLKAAVLLAKRLFAVGKMTPEVMQTLLHLQDDPDRLRRAIAR